MSKTPSALIITVLAFSIFFGACKRSDDGRIHLGVILSLTGAAAPYGQDNLHGLQLALKLVNAQGGVHGKKVTLDVQDTAGDPAQAISIAKRFAADSSVVALLGPTRTGDTLAVAKILPQLSIPMMSVGSTGDWRSSAGEFNEWTFRSTRVDTYLVPALLQAARDRLKIKRLAVIYTSNDDWSVSVLKVYQQAAAKLGLQIVDIESQTAGDPDRSAQLTKIKNSNPDALIINTLSTDAPSIAFEARRLGIRSRFLGTAGFASPETWKLAPPGTLDGTWVADNYYPDSPRPAVRSFVDQYRTTFGGEPSAYAAYAYDGLRLVADACRRAADPFNRRMVRDALGSTRDFDGVLGSLTYHDKGDSDKIPFILEIRGQNLVPVGTPR